MSPWARSPPPVEGRRAAFWERGGGGAAGGGGGGGGDDRARHGRGEEQGAAALGRRVEYLLEILSKAHVEHLVGLVEHDDLERGQIEGAALEMVAQPPRRADDDVGAVRQRPPNFRRVHAADAGGDAPAGRSAEPA